MPQVPGETAALDHEITDHPVKDRAVVKAIAGVGQEIGDGFGSLIVGQFQRDRAKAGIDLDLLSLIHI